MSGITAVARHVAIVMDGNGRWASKRFLPRVAGHKQGVATLKTIVRAAAERGVQILTVFAFSSENWNRPADEVSGLMELLFVALSREVSQLEKDGVQLHFVGSHAGLSDKVLKGLREAEQATAHNSRLVLNVCFNYGGRWDIVQAAQKLVEAGQAISEETLSQQLALSPDPDLLIRTGGEMRISNFLLWQCAYTEMVFSDHLWPDFDAAALDAALADYASRQRRFGKTPEQLSETRA